MYYQGSTNYLHTVRREKDRYLRLIRSRRADKKSDVDVLVDFLPDRETYQNYMNLADFLEELCRRKVDLHSRMMDLLPPETIYRQGCDLD